MIALMMHNRYSFWLLAIFKRVFGQTQMPERSVVQISELSQQGSVVHIIRGHSSWLALYFNYVFIKAHLPLPQFVGGVLFLIWQPLDRVFKLLRQRFMGPRIQQQLMAYEDLFEKPANTPLTQEESALIHTVLTGQSAFIVLPTQHSWQIRRAQHDFIYALVVAQRQTERPIFIVAHALTEKIHSGVAGGSLSDKILGSRRQHGTLRQLSTLFSTFRNATIGTSEAINLQTLVQQNKDLDNALLARKVKHLTHRSISDEERVVAGPELRSFELTARHVLRDPSLREVIETQTKEHPKKLKTVIQKVRSHLKHIAAQYNVRFIQVSGHILHWIFHRIYDGIIVDESGFNQVMDVSRKGLVVYCPSHRSHIDYLVLSYVLWQRGITPPHIAAGANLAFFPLGAFFRRCGAFFLRRTFRDDPLYAATFKAYIAELVRTGTAIEFFLEGTRSRTGKLLMPKFGLLHMIIDSWRRQLRADIYFVPVSIDYERIIEANAYHKELAGGNKQQENIGGLLQTTKVLRSRYGRVQVQFGKPLSLTEFAQTHALAQSKEEDNQWRPEITRLGFQILHGVAQVCSITPTAVVATALLGHQHRGIAEGHLVALCHSIVNYLDTLNARITNPLQTKELRSAAFIEAVRKLVDDKLVISERAGRNDNEPIYHAPEANRTFLDFHKNAVMNYFATGAILARALRSQSVSYSELRERCLFLSQLFKNEFIYPVETSFDENFNNTLNILKSQNFLSQTDEYITITDKLAITHLCGLLDSFIQGYWITVVCMRDLRSFPLWRKELSIRALERGRRAFLEGTITRPEAVNRTLIENAIDWLKDHHILTMQTVGKRQNFKLHPECSDAKFEQFLTRLADFL